jgi:hypothetical protein
MGFASPGATNSMENFSPHLPDRTPIIWQSTMTNLPKSLWIYKRILPHIFPTAVISNAIVLASYQSRGIPRPSTNDTCIFEDPNCDCPCGCVCNFSIHPGYATIDFHSPDKNSRTDHLPDDEAIVNRAQHYAAELGIELTNVVVENLTSHFNTDTNGNRLTNRICGRGVFLSRQLDRFCFWSNEGESPSEGFWIEFGSFGKIRAFSLTWPNLARYQDSATASPQQIIACIRAHRVIVIPDGDENYFARVRSLGRAKSFTLTKITPYYRDGGLEGAPDENGPPPFAVPFAELEAVADFGNSRTTVRIVAPILSSEVTRLLR